MSPPYTITPHVLRLVADIGEKIGRIEAVAVATEPVQLRRENRIRTVHASLSIEGNSLDLDQVTAIFDGKRVLGPAKDIQEIRNAITAYEDLPQLDPFSSADLCRAHRTLMRGLVDAPGEFRRGNVGIQRGDEVVHIAPGADRVPFLVSDLLEWLRDTADHPLIKGSVFHYEFEFIHPFPDGNGRLGRLWQTRILQGWKPIFQLVPIESVIQHRQSEYYGALRAADARAEATPFIEFMLEAVLLALTDLAMIDPVTDQVTDPVRALLLALRDSPKNTSSLMKKLSLSHRPTFRANYLKPALEQVLVEMTLPEKPTSSHQKYRLTNLGRSVVSKLGAGKRRRR